MGSGDLDPGQARGARQRLSGVSDRQVDRGGRMVGLQEIWRRRPRDIKTDYWLLRSHLSPFDPR